LTLTFFDSVKLKFSAKVRGTGYASVYFCHILNALLIAPRCRQLAERLLHHLGSACPRPRPRPPIRSGQTLMQFAKRNLSYRLSCHSALAFAIRYASATIEGLSVNVTKSTS